MKYLAALLLLLCAPGPPQPKPPNLLFIHADDLGYGDLGCYGQQKIPTPNIDRLAAEGMRFTQYYAGSTVCAPSRCVLMTGLHTGGCFIRGNAKADLRPGDTTVAEVLKGAGYATGLAGKWGLGHEGSPGVPTKKGFDFFYGYLDQTHAHNYWPTFLMRNEERVKLKNVVPNEGPVGQGVASERVEYSADLIHQEALAFLTRNREKPFFLYLAPTLPHANNEAKNKGMEIPDYGEFKDKDWPDPEKGRAAMIALLDRNVGAVMQRLKELGIDQETIVFFTSDNGPHNEGGSSAAFFNSSGPLRGSKRDLTEGGIRVPMIVRWPGRIAAGAVNDFIWAHQDFLPTAAELAGAKAAPVDGFSVVKTLLGKAQTPHNYLYWEFYERGFDQAIRMGDWKAIRNGLGEPLQLYNLKTDLMEKTNVAARNEELVAKLDALMKYTHSDSEQWVPKKVKK
ncbi:MAG: arylsulfatase [Planctomycetes bacterium]|nr:arylsulfatase [Planctomycetota bacterium]